MTMNAPLLATVFVVRGAAAGPVIVKYTADARRRRGDGDVRRQCVRPVAEVKGLGDC